ncbi:hypothetical protein CRENBAI_010269 [Crenichthys baileyi]|uniref:Uncharacterized protein n=1 Tax=Crenichthys baileyi TaxID=28760 RepID=A0AAV9QPQ8_9TELE
MTWSTPPTWMSRDGSRRKPRLRYTCTLDFWFWVGDEVVSYKNWVSDGLVDDCDMSGAMETGGKPQWKDKKRIRQCQGNAGGGKDVWPAWRRFLQSSISRRGFLVPACGFWLIGFELCVSQFLGEGGHRLKGQVTL